MKYHFPFYLQGLHDAPNQSEPHNPTLDLFHLNMTPLSGRKLEVSRNCSVATGGGGYLKINALVFMIHAAITPPQHGEPEKHVC